jgi:hypothetical protein
MIDFLLVGSFKAGSTSIAYELTQSDDVFVPKIKDPYFFLRNSLDKYQQPNDFVKFQKKYSVLKDQEFFNLFKDNKKKIQGEATPLYLYLHDDAIRNIKQHNRDTKIIIVLRNPINRAFSNFSHNKKDGFENFTFLEKVRNYNNYEKSNTHPFFHYVKAGFYFNQVKAYKENFNNVHVMHYEDFVLDPKLEINKILNFLGASEIEQLLNIRLNKTGKVRYKHIHKILNEETSIKKLLRPLLRFLVKNRNNRKLLGEYIKNKNIIGETVDKESTLFLKEVYKGDIDKLSQYLNFDYNSFWLK